MKYKKMIISIVCVCFFNCSFGQFNVFIKNFKKCSLPFVIKDATFDIYQAEDDVYAISEIDFAKYLMMKNDTFINLKEFSAPTGYHKYIAVGKFDLYDNLLSVLYYRYIINEKGNHIQELMLCVFTKKGELISTYPVSGYYTAEKKIFFSTIFSEEDIEISFYKLEISEDRFGISYLISENVIEKRNLYITKEGIIQQK